MGSPTQTRLRSVPALERAPAHVTLTLPADPENVSAVRHVLGAFAESLALPEELIEDMRLAVTEACTNVVRHAYPPGDSGPMEVAIRPEQEYVAVTVTDRGRGIGASADTTGPGLGLPLITAIADDVELQPVPGGGSRVALTFTRHPRGDAA
jgi:serine/threonine-protein kinase RsbW